MLTCGTVLFLVGIGSWQLLEVLQSLSILTEQETFASQMIFICAVAALGNFVYAIPFSPVFPLIGRSLQGIGDSTISMLSGEIIRIFPKHLVMKKVSTYIAFRRLAMIISPALVVFFQSVRIELFHWIYLGPFNSPNVFVGILWLVGLLLTILFVDNLSKMYDLKHEEMEELETSACHEKDKQREIPLRKLLTNGVYNVVLLLNIISAYASPVNFAVLLPVIATEYYNLSTGWISAMYSICCLAFGAFAVVMNKINYFGTEIYFVVI